MEAAQSVRMCVLGTGHVGKSALTIQFVYDEFVEDYEPTKCAAFKRRLEVDGVTVEVHIIDTAGQEDYAGIYDPYYRSNDGFLVLFSVTDRESFNAVPGILDRMSQCRASEPTFVAIVGNKVDLVSHREVRPEEAIELAQHRKVPYIETSAKACHNVQEAFLLIIREVVRLKMASRRQPEQVNSTGSCCCQIS